MTALGPDIQAAAATRARELTAWERLRRHPAGNITIVFGIALIACVVIGLIIPEEFRFVSRPNIVILLKGIPLLGFISLGVGILMISGEFDLSVGATFQLTSFMMVQAFKDGWPLGLAVLLALVTGLAVGLVNGAVTTRLRIPSFITTLGTFFIVRGVLLFASQARPINFFPGDFVQDFLTGSIGIMQAQFVWFLVFAVLVYLLVHTHRLGNHFFAVGGNRDAAIAVGINVDRVKIIAFILCSLGATVAGIISATRVNGVTPEASTNIELQAIAVCVVGGLFLTGGRGAVLGIIMGAFLVNIAKDVLFLVRAPGLYLDMFFGAVIMVAVILNSLVAKR